MLETSGALIGNMAFAAYHPFMNDGILIVSCEKVITTSMNATTPAQMVTAKNDSNIELNKGAILSDETAKMIKNGRGLDNINGLYSSGEMAKMMTAKMDSGATKPNEETPGSHGSAAGNILSFS
jgi:hypothetical protein